MPKQRRPRSRDLLRFRASSPSWQTLAWRHMANGCPALALAEVERALAAKPTAGDRSDAETLRTVIEPVVEQRIVELGATGPDGMAALMLHEQAVEALGAGELDAAAGFIRELLDTLPDCVPALNNLSLIAWVEDRPDDAIGLARRVLAHDPDNVNALANLVTYLFRRGQLAEAEAVADRLRQVAPSDETHCLKQAEAFSYLGDDAAVLDSYARAVALAAAMGDDYQLPADLVHLAAVAEHRQGRPDVAEALWREIADRPGISLTVRGNLADLRRPPGERSGPWAFEAADWLGGQVISDIAQHARPSEVDTALAILRRYLEHNPGFEQLVPAILDRGPHIARAIVMMVIDDDQIPETDAIADAVRSFALGQLGTDDERERCHRLAMRRGWLASGTHRMWLGGEWQDRQLLGFQLHDEQSTPHGPQVTRWMLRASELQQDGRFGEAEALIRKALAAEPDAPDLHYNFAALRQAEGRRAESLEMVLAVYARWPDYLFARCQIAEMVARSGDVAEARRLVDHLLLRPRLHFSEFRALASALIVLELADDNLEAAEGWLDMVEQVEPDHPTTAQSRRRVEEARRRR